MHRKAAQTAYNYRDSPDREAYARRAIRKHGQKFWTLAMSLLARIEEVEVEQPDACRAVVEAEAILRYLENDFGPASFREGVKQANRRLRSDP